MIKSFYFLIFLFMFILSSVSVLLADEIRLKDGTVITGKIIQVTAGNIEYDPEGPRPFDLIPRDQVVEIIYDDGQSVKFNNDKIEKPGRGETFIEKPAQEESAEESTDKGKTVIRLKPRRDMPTQKEFRNFLEFELGWNGYVGNGVRFERLLLEDFAFNVGAGYCLWGYRFSGGLRYYLHYPFGLAFGLGASYSTGLSEYKVDMETEDASGNENPDKEEVIFDLKPVGVVNITILYSWKVFSTHRIYVESGYGIRLTDDYYTINKGKLTKDSKDIMDTMAPGGSIITFGYAISI